MMDPDVGSDTAVEPMTAIYNKHAFHEMEIFGDAR
jgi:hypothetical protein